MADGVRERTRSRPSTSSVAETTQIGDGPQVRRPNRPNRQIPPFPGPNRRLLTAVEQRLRTSPLRRAALMRKLRLQRSLDFYSGLRGSHAGPGTVFGFHPAANVDQPVFGNWYGGMGLLQNHDDDDAEEEEEEEEQGSRHWDPAQLHFQQYLRQGQSHLQPLRSYALSLDLGDLQLVGDLLCGWGQRTALRLALNEVFHLFHQ